MTHTILIAEDDPLQRRMLATILGKKLGHTVISTTNGKEAFDRIQDSNIDEIHAVLLDINMPVMNGFETLKAIRTHRPDLPVLMLTSSDDTELAVKAIKEGASDFVVKPPEPAHLNIAISNAIRLSALSQELSKLKRDKEGAIAFRDLVSYRAGLAQPVAYGRKAASSDVPVLLMGETGTGKELFARTIHGESRRAGGPFVAVNCSALSHHIEPVLFGDERTPAPNNAPRALGKIRAAEGGTLFLDDITELPADIQVRLLRVLQQREIEPMGGGRPVKVNLRLITASDRDLRREVEAGRFREDLYFRLNILPITLPALRERRADILPLAEHFISRISLSDRLAAKSLTADAQAYLIDQAWPGNVRELEGLIHRALVLSDAYEIDRDVLESIHESSAPLPLVEQQPLSPLSISLHDEAGNFKPFDVIEAEAMQTALKHFHHNVTHAAQALGIAKSTFYRKLKNMR